MGSDVVEVVGRWPEPCSCKVPFSMCRELQKFVLRIRRLLPTIEEARPPGTAGIKALSSLNEAILKATKFIQTCRESSKLYLVVTADDKVLRCKRFKNLLEQSLVELQTMVHPKLVQEISYIVDDIRNASFSLNSSEEEAFKAMKRVIYQRPSVSDPIETSEICKALQMSASAFHVTSTKAIWEEKEAIMNKLKEVGDSEETKKRILKYLYDMLKKYANSIMQEQSHDCVQNGGEFALENDRNSSTHCLSADGELCLELGGHREAQVDILSRAAVPAEYRCRISSRLMYDPVTIASGETFERMYIQKWFDEGNDTCPQTKRKLANLSLTPNVVLKDLITKWCTRYGVTLDDPSTLPAEVLPSLENTSSSISILGGSMNDLRLRMDVLNVSIGSLDTSYTSDSSPTKTAGSQNLTPMQGKMDLEDVKRLLDHSNDASSFELLVRFLKNAHDQNDVKAQKAGSQLLLKFLNKKRSRVLFLREEVYCLLATIIDSEATEEALDILDVLSGHQHCRSKIVASGALTSIIKTLDSSNRHFQERAIKILLNFSSPTDASTNVMYLGCIPKLVPLLLDSTLAGRCLYLLKNLCRTEEGRSSVAEASGCIVSVAALLASGSCEDQENALDVLIPLCSQRAQCCQLLMDEGVTAALDNISVNGSERAKVSALELQRLLKDVDTSRDSKDLSKKKKPWKGSGPLGRLSFFTRPSLAVGKN